MSGLNLTNYLTEDEFDAKFVPIKNEITDGDVGWNGCFFETSGKELKFVRKQNPDKIWTVVCTDGCELLLISGFHFVNRVNYLITEHAVPKDTFYSVKLEGEIGD